MKDTKIRLKGSAAKIAFQELTKHKHWKPTWSQNPPEEQGEYWHWSGDEGIAPLPMFIMKSLTSGKCFVSAGQLGIRFAIDCDKYGGWWMKLEAPILPKTV